MSRKILTIKDVPIFNMYIDEEGTLHVNLVAFIEHIEFIPFALKEDEIRQLYELYGTNPKPCDSKS